MSGCNRQRKPDAAIVEEGISPALSSILVPFVFAPKGTVSDIEAYALSRRQQQLLNLVYAIFQQQPIRRFCWAISLSSSHLHVLAVTRSGTLSFFQESPFVPDNAPVLGTLLNFLHFCSPPSLGFLPDVLPESGDERVCPIGNVLVDFLISSAEQQRSPERQDGSVPRGPIAKHPVRLVRPLVHGSEPWGRDTTVFSVLVPSIPALQQPVVKLTWLEDKHFVDSGTDSTSLSIEELVLIELGRALTSDSFLSPSAATDSKQLTKAELRERVATLKACKVLVKSGNKTAVLYLLDGTGDKLTKNTFSATGDLVIFLSEMWKSMSSL